MSGSNFNNEPTSQHPLLELDASLYAPSRDEVEFLKGQTKIENEEELKQHVLAIQREAWASVPYRCIQAFGFITLKISYLPVYQDLLKLGRERPGSIFLDLACCFGNDVRKAVADGYPMENAIASDIVEEFWELGHQLFKSTPETFPVPFIQGDVIDPQHLAPASPFNNPPTTPRPILSKLTSLTPLQGHISALHVSAFFHLFNKDEQIKLAHLLAPLLSPLPGSMIFGTHTTLDLEGGVSGESKLLSFPKTIYCFNPKDWCALWDGVVFKKGVVCAEAWFPEDEHWRGKGFDKVKTPRRSMVWSVKRI